MYNIWGIVAALVVCLVAYFKWRYNYWQRKNVYTPSPTIPIGNLIDLVLRRKSFPELMRGFYEEFKSKGLKHAGLYFFANPVYIPLDLEVVKNILVKDFPHFMNHGGYIDEQADPLTGHLFTLEDEKWRNLRIKLTPTFTSGKMKMMFETLVDCTRGLNDVMDESYENKTPLDIKDVLSRLGTDVIGSCAFGIECNSLKDSDSPFRRYGRLATEPNFWQHFRNFFQVALPRSVLAALGFRLHRKDLADFFMKIVKDTVDYREKNKVYRKDFMQLLLQLKNRGEVSEDDSKIMDYEKIGNHMTIPEMTAQCFIFFLAGADTSSTLNTFAIYEMSRDQKIQHKLRDEINSVMKKYDGKLTYDAVKEMTYMDKVLHETLRMYGSLPVLLRVCTKDYTIPGESLTIEKGTGVMIPVIGIHHDPEYYPDPDKFDPERFSEEAKASRPAFTWLPFGEGPRLCIGMRFGIMQAKVGLAALLKNYRFSVNKKTIQPLEWDKDGFTFAAKGKIWIDVDKIK